MSKEGLNSLQLISISKSTVDKDIEYKGFNTDSGTKSKTKASSNKSQKKVRYEHNNTKDNIGNVISVFDLHNQSVGKPIDIPIMEPMIGNKINNRNNLSFSPSVLGLEEDFFKLDGYTREDVIRYKEKMEAVKKGEGALFSLDMETFGVNPRLNPGAPNINKENYAISELSLWKTTYDSKTDTWNREKIKSVYSKPNSTSFKASRILKDEAANSDTAIMVERIVGYSGDNSVVYNPKTKKYEVKEWLEKVDVTSEQNLTNGIDNVNKLPLRGSKQNIDEKREFMEYVTSSLKNKKNILTSKNGLLFDLPHFIGEAYNLNINENVIKDFVEELKTGHFDVQIFRQQFASDITYKKAQELREKGIDVNDSLTLENLNKINTYGNKELEEEIVKTFGGKITHTADYDTFMTTIESIKVYDDAKETLDLFESTSLKPMNIDEKSKFIANGKFVANKDSFHFKVEDGRVNSYNSSILTRDQAYNLKVSQIKSIDEINKIIESTPELTDELNKVGASFEDVSSKFMIELQASNSPKDKVFMFYDKLEDFQSNMIDSGLLSQINETEYTEWLNGTSRNFNDLDDLRKEMEGYGTSTSWKQVDRLEQQVDQYKALQTYKVDDVGGSRVLTRNEIDTILKGNPLLINGKEYNADSVLTKLSSNIKDDSGKFVSKVSSEKLKSFRLMYNDLEANADLYSELLDEGRKNVDFDNYINTFKKSKGFDKQLQKNYIDDLSLVFGSSIDEIEDRILNSKTESQKLDYVINNDKELLDIYNKKIDREKKKILKKDSEALANRFNKKQDYKSLLNNIVIPTERKEKLMKQAYKERFREDFSLDSKTVNAILKDSKELFNKTALTSIDILTPDGDYTALKFNNKANYIEDLKRTINTRVIDAYKDKAASNRDRLIYADDIANDLRLRGLISEEDFEIIKKADKVQSKSTLITDSLFTNKEKAVNIVEASLKDVDGINTFEDAIVAGNEALKNLYNPKIISDEDFAIAKPFVENVSMQPKWYRDTRSIMRNSISKHVKALANTNVQKIVTEQARKVAPNITLIGYSSSKNAQEQIAKSFQSMYDNLGWEKKHIDLFKELYKNGNIDKEIIISGSGDTKNLSKFIVNDGKDYHLLISTNEKLTKQKIANGETIEELAKSVASFKLPKIEKSLGAVMVSQSDTAKKTVSNAVIPVQIDKSVHYELFDTVQEVLSEAKDSLYYVRERLEDKDFISANRRLNKSWRDINESKSLTADTYKYVEKDGKLAIEYVYGINRSDVAKADIINQTGIIYELDSVLNKSDSLSKEFYNLFSLNTGGDKTEANRIRKLLKEMTSDVADYSGNSKPNVIKHLSELYTDGTKIGIFLNNNIQEIAKTLLDDKEFMSGRGKEIKDYLEIMFEKGNVAVIGKPLETSSGYVNPESIADYVPHSNFSNTARETMVQGMNGQSIYEDSIVAAYNHRLKDVLGETDDVEKIFKKLGIKRNFGVTTPKILKLTDSFYEEENGMLAISTKAKSITATKLNEELINIHDNVGGLHDEINNMLSSKYGIQATKEELQEAAKIVSASASLYEDSSMMNVIFADYVNPITASNQRVYKPNEKLEIGMTVNKGDVIGHDVYGEKIFAKDTSVIKNIDNGRIIFQLEENNLSIKGNINHSEKTVMIAPSYKTGDKAKDERMKKILSQVQYTVTGEDVNIAWNPNSTKHDAQNVPIISNEMAIVEAITDDSEAEIVRKAFKTHSPNLDIDIVYDKVRKEYVVQNIPRTTSLEGVNPIAELQATIKSLESEGDLGKRITANINLLNDKGIAYVDLVYASNNTLFRGMDGQGEGSGTSISTRAFAVKGTYLELDEELISKYENGTFFKHLLEEDTNKILNANKDGAREVANIYAALDAMNNEKAMPHANVKKKSIKDIILPNGLVETNKLDDLFKYDPDTNLFEVDLSDFGIEIDNPFYKEGGPHSKKINKIFVPVTNPNIQGNEGARASKLQSAQVDLFRKIKEARFIDENNGKTIRQLHDEVSKSAQRYVQSMFYELRSNDGLRYKIQKTKENIGSFRSESHKVVAPIIDKETGLLKDLAFGDKITTIKNGKVQYTRSAFLNESDVKKIGVDFDLLGEDILSKQVSDSNEQLEFLKNFMSKKDVNISHVQNLKEAQNIIKSNYSKSFTNESLASSFLEELGFESQISRDPIIRYESETGIMTKTAKGINAGATSVDPITGQGMKGDSDGDEFNFIFSSFEPDENGVLRIREYNHPVRQELRMSSTRSSTSDLNRLNALGVGLKSFEEKNSNAYSLDNYAKHSNLKYMMEDISSKGDVSYFTNPTARKITNNALMSKNLIGSTSNPGLYIKMAGLEVAQEINKINPKLALAFDKSLSIGTLAIEQNAIDQKLNKFGPGIAEESTKRLFNAIKIGDNWKNLHKAVRSENKDEIIKSVTAVVEMMSLYAKEGTDHEHEAIKFMSGKVPEGPEDISKMVNNIINKTVDRNPQSHSVFLEEVVADVITVFENDTASELYESAYVARSGGSLNQIQNDIHDEMSKVIALRDGNKYKGISTSVAIKQANFEANLSDSVLIGETKLEDGVKIGILGQGHNVEQGIYEVQLNGYKDGKHSINLIGENGMANISKDNVFEINNILSQREAVILSEKELSKFEDILFNKHKTGVEDIITSSHGAFNAHLDNYKQIIENGGPTTIKDKAIVSAMEGYNLENLADMHNTLDVLANNNYVLDDRSDILKEMNDAIRAKGTKEYQARKKEVLLSQKGLQQYPISNYDKFMSDISKSVADVKPSDYSEIKELLNSNKRLNMKNIINSKEVSDVVMKNIELSGKEFSGIELEQVILNTQNQILGYFESVDESIFQKLNSVFTKNQNDANFRKEVLGWNMNEIDELLLKGNEKAAIDKMNNMTMIFSRDFSGKKLGEMSLEELKKVLEISDKTGISEAVAKENSDIVYKLIQLRQNNDIMLESIKDPILENLSENIGKDLTDQMIQNIKEKGSTSKKSKANNKSTSSSISNIFEKAKSKISGLSTKQKIFAGAIAATGIGATMMLGNNVSNGRAKLNTSNQEVESNLNNSSQPQVPPSSKSIYVSDNNSINVNVRGRAPINSSPDIAERAISTLFGKNISVNSNINDSRETIHDRDVDELMDKAIR